MMVPGRPRATCSDAGLSICNASVRRHPNIHRQDLP
jgi:hypothetical protein